MESTACENSIFKGVTDTMFMPDNIRHPGPDGHTVLWRMNGSPEPKNANPFGDVAATSPLRQGHRLGEPRTSRPTASPDDLCPGTEPFPVSSS
ncbi:MAG: hypothetical protein ACLU38_03290 [Dysosmobacter sp.]